MAGLYLTPTRKALLQEVADGKVIRTNGIGAHLYDHYRAGYGGGIGRRLNIRVAEMEAAGWIELVVEEPWRQVWRITDAGRTVLDGALR